MKNFIKFIIIKKYIPLLRKRFNYQSHFKIFNYRSQLQILIVNLHPSFDYLKSKYRLSKSHLFIFWRFTLIFFYIWLFYCFKKYKKIIGFLKNIYLRFIFHHRGTKQDNQIMYIRCFSYKTLDAKSKRNRN